MLKNYENVGALISTKKITTFLSLAGVASFLPFVFHLQWVTGPIVNAILIIALFLLGRKSALALCLIPSLMALAGGLLPVILAPMVPFIMAGNAIMVLAIDFVGSRFKNSVSGYWFGIFIGAALKYLFLYSFIVFFSRTIFSGGVWLKVSQILSWPQFATALIGGVLAWFILKMLKRL